jgi:CRP-like cAMP-binding protein
MTTPWNELFGYKSGKKPDDLQTVELLSRTPIFEGLDRRELATVERILHRRVYQRNEVLFRQGERGLGMYIVQHGTVAITTEPGNLELFEMKDGDFFGEVALLDEGPRSATAVAKTDCEVFGFFQPDLFGLISRDARLGVKIVVRLAKITGQRLRIANERVVALTAEIEAFKRAKPGTTY